MSAPRRWRAMAIAALVLLAVCLTIPRGLRFVRLPASLHQAPSGGIKFTDRNGLLLRESLLEGGRFTAPVSIDKLPPNLLAATF